MPQGPRAKVSRKDSRSERKKLNAEVRRRKLGVQHDSIKNIRAVVLGKDGVGKSALTVRLLTRRYIGEYDSSLESIYRHHMELKGHYISLDIMDTAGKNTDDKLREYAAFGNLFLFLFSITDRSSFEEAKRMARFMKRTKTGAAHSAVVVGTKRDLSQYRVVSEDDGRLLANEIGACYREVSSAQGYEETEKLLRGSVWTHVRCLLADRDKQLRGLGKVREGPLVRRKTSYRK